MNNHFSTPILFNTFNRPEETAQVIQVLRENKVPILFVHSDGPRQNCKTDIEDVHKVRQLIDQRIDWDCDLHKLYEDSNLGCGVGPYKAISWFFQNVDEGIILEDDCLPHPDFFIYCQDLLERFRNNEQIYVIGGTNRHPRKRANKYSYHFSPYMEIWGWATWKRVWQEYEYNFEREEEDFFSNAHHFLRSKSSALFWTEKMKDAILDGKNKSYWDYQLQLLAIYNKKISIIPNCNLISNIGFNIRATHTISNDVISCGKPTNPILPIHHPKHINSHNFLRSFEYNPRWKHLKRIIKDVLHYRK